MENEKSYYAFVLGYDLLNKELGNIIGDCDNVYEACLYLAEKFLNSKEYKDYTHNAYDMLIKWLENNRTNIKNYLENEEEF